VIPTVPAVGVPLATTLLVVGYLLVRFAGSVGAETVPEVAGGDGRRKSVLGKLPYSPFARRGRVARAGDDHPRPRVVVAYWLLGGVMLGGGVVLAVGSLL